MTKKSGYFIHIGFNFTGEVPVKALEKLFDSALDWLRYDTHCWLLYTTTDLDTWRDRIRKTPGILPADSFFLCEFRLTDYSGYMHEMVWEWLKKRTS